MASQMTQENMLKYGTFGALTLGFLLLLKPLLTGDAVNQSATIAENSTGNPTGTVDLSQESLMSLRRDLASATEASWESQPSQFASTSTPGRFRQASARSNHAPTPVLQVGRIGNVPRKKDLKLIASIPRSESELKRIFNMAKAQSCSVLNDGVEVDGPLSLSTGQYGVVGRVNAMTIGLELDEIGRRKLPSIAVSEVLKYFSAHQLSVQPTLYHDEAGKIYFGNGCKAAFYKIGRSAATTAPEPMINAAVGQFRTLGIVATGQQIDRNQSSDELSVGRTMALAFAFEQADELSSSTLERTHVHELMLLHIPETFDLDYPRIDVFVTRNHGQTLHQIDTKSVATHSTRPLISARVRFDQTTMMGMYPADPVVTNIQFHSIGAMPMANLHHLSSASREHGGISVSEILDRFDSYRDQELVQPRNETAQPLADEWTEKDQTKEEQEFQSFFRTALQLSEAE